MEVVFMLIIAAFACVSLLGCELVALLVISAVEWAHRRKTAKRRKR